ncbi:MAG: YwiC-like family protein [Thermoanaerobaculia bacterium]
MTTATLASPVARPRPALRPLALPTEHGGWGFLFEPIVLGLAVAPSRGGLLVALAFVCGFLCRQPLRLALQDALRGRAYPRTRWCWLFFAAYALCAGGALALAVFVSGWAILIPIGMVAPMGLTQILYDARNRGRTLLPELGGAAAMSSSAAAIAIAAGMRIVPALALSGIIVARAIPSIVYVRTLLARSHGRDAAAWPSLVLHAVAIVLVALFAKPLVVVAMVMLFARAAWQLSRPAVPPARKIGWREIALGAITVALAIF